LITFGLFMIVINAAIFGLAAWLVDGFRLRWGIWSALLGALALSFINSLLYQLLSTLPSR
jgi:putative membrane protein